MVVDYADFHPFGGFLFENIGYFVTYLIIFEYIILQVYRFPCSQKVGFQRQELFGACAEYFDLITGKIGAVNKRLGQPRQLFTLGREILRSPGHSGQPYGPTQPTLVAARNHSLILDVPAEKEVKNKSDSRKQNENRNPSQ